MKDDLKPGLHTLFREAPLIGAKAMITDRIYHALAGSPGLKRQFRRVVKRLPHRQRLIEHLGKNLIVDPTELSGFYLYYEREYDNHIFSFMQERVGRYARAIDLGANIGVYTVFLADSIPSVDAFEPDEAVMTRLRSNLELNGLSNVRTHRLCVGAGYGAVQFLRGDPTNHGLGRIVQGGCDRAQAVESVSLDEFFRGPVETPTFMKMDIEGAEWLVLQGCANSIGKRTARVDMLIEIHPDNIRSLGGSVGRLYQMLVKLGFRVEALTPGGLAEVADDYTDRFWWATGHTGAD